MKFWSFTLGCKVNQYETELFKEQVLGPGDTLAENPAEADVCFINTCTVTAFADKEGRQVVRRVLRENPNARVIVTGCYATRSLQDLRKISGRLEIYSNSEKRNLPSCFGFEIDSVPLGICRFADRSRAFLKIQDGCQAPCSYCVIPQVRPKLWSKPADEVLAEAMTLIRNGYQEIVLTGIRLGLYHGVENADGLKPGLINLVGLLGKLVALPGEFRLRLSSLEVTEISDEMLDFVSRNSKICRHFHVPLQAGSSGVLKAMNRWYDLDFFKGKVNRIREAIPDCGLTTDVMAGFPTETENQFQEGLNNIEEMDFSGMHIFRFSGREGTKAASLKALPPQTVQARAKALAQVDEKLRRMFYNRFEGTIRETLCEPTGEGWTDNYIRVEIPKDLVKTGLLHTRVYSARFSIPQIKKRAQKSPPINV